MKRQDEASPIEFLLSELAHLPVSDAAKSEFMGLLRRMAGQRVQLKKALILTPYRIRIAANMLNNGNRPPAVRESIMRSAGISRATSYKIIGKALNHRANQLSLFLEQDQKGESNGTV